MFSSDATENAENSDSWKQGTRRNLPTLPVQGNLYGQRLQEQSFKHEEHKPSIHDEGLPLLAEEVWNYSRILNIFNGSTEDQFVGVVDVHVFANESSRSSWTELFDELGSLQEHELRGKIRSHSISHKN